MIFICCDTLFILTVWVLCEFCCCRTVLLCSVTVVRMFLLYGCRKADISSWLFYHNLWAILWYVSRSLWNLSLHPSILFSDFHRSWWAALSSLAEYMSDGDSSDELFYFWYPFVVTRCSIWRCDFCVNFVIVEPFCSVA